MKKEKSARDFMAAEVMTRDLRNGILRVRDLIDEGWYGSPVCLVVGMRTRCGNQSGVPPRKLIVNRN